MTGPPPNEPSTDTFAAIGHLCGAWAYVEMLSERTLWGVLGLNEEQGRAFVWRMQLVQRWQMIVREAARKYDAPEVNELRVIKKMVEATQADRNIVVHGVIHAHALTAPNLPPYSTIGTREAPPPFIQRPCWTIYMGDDAGKNFLVSADAVNTIIDNAVKTHRLIEAYNTRKLFTNGTPIQEGVAQSWPRPL